ncbi:exoribonuclease [Salmonella phage SE_PL]|nr:hypothetical protein 7t3_0543 [Salmonella phage 7t3]QIG62675.1 exoribonuclease [Salmonella phage SE_PL]WNV47472.1 hypothetical protein [Klebsiella phage fENko-Kae01]
MERRDVTIDIETWGTPENSGYNIIIPNYALVVVPEEPRTYDLEWMYVQMPIQPQINKGLSLDADALSFWHDMCAKEYSRAYEEMKKSLTLNTCEIRTRNYAPTASKGDSPMKVNDPTTMVEFFISNYSRNTGKLWGNGCNFDCSILQENHRVMYNNGKMWRYDAPQNARSLKDLLSDEERAEMDSIVQDYLGRFETTVRVECGLTNLQLHHPLYDAAREALQVSYCRMKKKG